jgi:ATP/maltotriose-dependent transcriptional regulator MalT
MADLKDRQEMRPYELMTRFGLGALAGTSPNMGTNFGQAGINTMNAYGKDVESERAVKRELAKLDSEGAAKDDARRLQLAGTLLTIQGHKDMKAAALANAPSGEERAINRAQALINNDPLIKKYIAQQKMLSETDPQYQVLDQRIAERQNQIFTTAGVKVPEITPSKIPDYVAPEKPGFFSSIFGGSKPESKPKVVQFNQLPS